MTSYNELRDGQEFYGNGYKKGYEDAKEKYKRPQGDLISHEALNKAVAKARYNGEVTMVNKIKQAVADEFKYRASQGRTNYSIEEIIYIVNEVIDEVNWESMR